MNKRSDFHYDEHLRPDSFLFRPMLNVLRNLKRKSILDLGCGNGGMLRKIAITFPDVQTFTGIDPEKSGIEIAQKLMPNGVFYTMAVDADPATVRGGPFDVVISVEVIEHLHYPSDLLTFAKSQLVQPSNGNEGGIFIITTPYHGYLKNLALALINHWDKDCRSPLWIGGHAKFWSASTLRTLLESEGFVIEKFIGCGRLPFLWKSMMLVCRLKR